jgi:prepilin peptidase CpaA
MLEMVVIVTLIVPFCLALAAISDLFTMKIPNKLSAAILVSFLVFAPLVGLGWAEYGMSIAAASAVFAVCFMLFAMNVMGGGDAKLLTATAIWFGFTPALISFLVTVAFVGGFITLIFLLLRANANTAMAMGIRLPASLVTESKIPYGIAIAIGGYLTFQQSPVVNLVLLAAS